MLATLLALCVAAPPSATKAVELARKHQWEELYLGYAAASPTGVSAADKQKISRALAQGCLALQGEDPVMAFSLGERSSAFVATADGLWCTAISGKRAEQRGAAEEALRTGVKQFKNDTRFALELGRLLIEDGQRDEGDAWLRQIGRKSKDWAEAQRLLLSRPREATPDRVEEADPVDAPPPLERARSRGSSTEPRATTMSYESSVDDEGRRLRQNRYFRFRYFNARRDFGQRADYEGAVQAALEDARRDVKRLLGATREKPLDVILYSRAEFTMHHGAQAANAVAGFYSQDAIRMNDSAEINDRNRATLVHEYVHAVMDELLSFNGHAVPTWMHEGTAEYIEWRSQGEDGPPVGAMAHVRQLAQQDRTPRLADLQRGALIGTSNPGLSYLVAGVGVRTLVQRRSMGELVALFEDCGRGQPFEQVLERRFGLTVEKLDEELVNVLRTRD